MDHVECAMALTLGGRFEEARAAYDWLKQTQAADGSWAMSYDELAILDSSVDSISARTSPLVCGSGGR